MPSVFRSVMKKHNLSPGDFPDITDFQYKLAEQDFTKFHHVKQKLVDDVESVLSLDFPRLMEALPRLDQSISTNDQEFKGYNGAGSGVTYGQVSYKSAEPDWNTETEESNVPNPFSDNNNTYWSLESYVDRYVPSFHASSKNGFVSGAAAKGILTSSGLAVASLRKIWDLADIDKDGQLDLNEFVIALYLSDIVKGGHPLPNVLSDDMIPPDKRF